MHFKAPSLDRIAAILGILISLGALGVFSFFGTVKTALENPAEIKAKYKVDSAAFTNTILLLEIKVNKQNQEIKILKEEFAHLKTGMSITSDCLKDELDITTVWDHKVYKTNPGNLWVFKADKYDIRTPLSLQPDWHEKQFFYQPIGSVTKIPLEDE